MDWTPLSDEELHAVQAVLDKWIDRAQSGRLAATASSSPRQAVYHADDIPDDRWEKAHLVFEQLWREVDAEIWRRLRGERE